MFKEQIKGLKGMSEGLCDEIAELENSAKEKRAQLRDINQALSSLERIQSKYEQEDEEVVIDEDAGISVQ